MNSPTKSSASVNAPPLSPYQLSASRWQSGNKRRSIPITTSSSRAKPIPSRTPIWAKKSGSGPPNTCSESSYNDRLTKQHLVTNAYRRTDHSDFPENVRAVLDTSITHRLLLERAERLGSDLHQIIRGLLEAHAYVNLRRAQGLVAVAQDYDPLLRGSCNGTQ